MVNFFIITIFNFKKLHKITGSRTLNEGLEEKFSNFCVLGDFCTLNIYWGHKQICIIACILIFSGW